MLEGLKVLLVEDEDLVRNYVARQLREFGCRVTEVESAFAALHALSLDDSFELLFSDIRLGNGPNGIELARRARAAFGSQLKVLLTTGYAEEALDPADQVHLIRKPYRREQLAEALTRATSGPSARPYVPSLLALRSVRSGKDGGSTWDGSVAPAPD